MRSLEIQETSEAVWIVGCKLWARADHLTTHRCLCFRSDILPSLLVSVWLRLHPAKIVDELIDLRARLKVPDVDGMNRNSGF